MFDDPPGMTLHPEEAAYGAKAVDKRRGEFAAERHRAGYRAAVSARALSVGIDAEPHLPLPDGSSTPSPWRRNGETVARPSS
ncbi:hypothetical protein [Microbispora sp. H11081]|uniref:hypothetical protein n=1 Tax=Microbispora sp. H11081 TaxID=2729107 RepID=UPI001B8D2141|nr:hypothetical protein [Microbispora sp. H11081]